MRQIYNWRNSTGAAKRAYTVTLDGPHRFVFLCKSRLIILLGGKRMQDISFEGIVPVPLARTSGGRLSLREV